MHRPPLFFWTASLSQTGKWYEQPREETMIIPEKLKCCDMVWVISPATSFVVVSEGNQRIARAWFAALGLRLSFGAHVEECNALDSSLIDSRLADFYAACADFEVKLVLAVVGGQSNTQLLQHIDWELLWRCPKGPLRFFRHHCPLAMLFWRNVLVGLRRFPEDRHRAGPSFLPGHARPCVHNKQSALVKMQQKVYRNNMISI